MTEEQKFNWWLDLACFVLTSEELAKHTDKSAAEWRSQITEEILQMYRSRAEALFTPGYVNKLQEKHEDWATDFLPRWQQKTQFLHLTRVREFNWADD